MKLVSCARTHVWGPTRGFGPIYLQVSVEKGQLLSEFWGARNNFSGFREQEFEGNSLGVLGERSFAFREQRAKTPPR